MSENRATGTGGDGAQGGKLATYREKRHFRRTREPRGADTGEGAGPDGMPVFVVQIHDARAMHFDFRLEVDGVLRSWAVPKGPSADIHDKRLAMPTEDHPMEYREFEGVIARGEYGAGTVIVWDEGTYEPLAGSTDDKGRTFAEALDHGHATFRLHGSKLHGGYALTRFRGGPDSGDRESWLLVKKKDARADGHDAPDPQRARSARTGRTLRQVAAESTPERPADTWETVGEDRTGGGGDLTEGEGGRTGGGDRGSGSDRKSGRDRESSGDRTGAGDAPPSSSTAQSPPGREAS
ncbi:DNA polymerase ligase N-terminal domain-containing protein [Streptomyces physcomitrii]|uniref:DNA polymerase ligase N-terminal domain-containing protein n=1 Tax=Streptomyces physcomitrii TaxID=2724184 RepID=UPI003F4CF070